MRIHRWTWPLSLRTCSASRRWAFASAAGSKTPKDYFLGGRTAPWWALAFSIVATETSTLTIIGAPAISYGGNLTFLQLVFGYLIGRGAHCALIAAGYFAANFSPLTP